MGKAIGDAFQLKRFSGKDGIFSPDSILKFLNEDIPKKYAPTRAALILIIGGGKNDISGEFDMKRIREGLAIKKIPFSGILFMLINSESLVFGEIWPNFGSEVHSYNEVTFEI